ncbi:hypothetical protein BHE74_00030936 [Ensete ventricosum]|nr:hypothetical protein BHE74_00030936 [Ensete ventricosum]
MVFLYGGNLADFGELSIHVLVLRWSEADQKLALEPLPRGYSVSVFVPIVPLDCVPFELHRGYVHVGFLRGFGRQQWQQQDDEGGGCNLGFRWQQRQQQDDEGGGCNLGFRWQQRQQQRRQWLQMAAAVADGKGGGEDEEWQQWERQGTPLYTWTPTKSPTKLGFLINRLLADSTIS